MSEHPFGTHAPAVAMANAVGDTAPQQEPRALDAMGDLHDFIRVVGDGEFYADYDASCELLGKAQKAIKVVQASLATPAEPVAAVTDALVGAACHAETKHHQCDCDFCRKPMRAALEAALVVPAKEIAPEILAAHAQFGGDLEDMQRRYDEGQKP